MKKIVLLAAALLMGAACYAQQALWGGAQIESPTINDNGTVTFKCIAPKAVKVQVTGDFLPTRKVQTEWGEFDAPGIGEFTEGKNGLWEYTTPDAVAPELYLYNLIIDGNQTLDFNNMWINRDVSTINNMFLVPGGRADYYAVRNVPHGTVSKVWYPCTLTKNNRRMTVYTPAGYNPTGKTRYPVVYILHGAGGDEDAWVTEGRATQILDNMIAEGKCKPMIAVFTNGNISQEAAPLENSTGYVKPVFRQDKQMEGSFEETFPEIVKYIDSHYKTIANKKSRAICGLSMGGFHTMYISLNYPDLFNYSGMFSAAVGVNDPGVSPLYQDVDAKIARYFSKKPALLWIGIGKTDFLYKQNEELRAKLDAAGYPYTYMETECGHIWKNWRIYLTEFLPKLF